MAPEIDKETLKQWHKALAAEDCCEVKKLLEKEKRLLNEIWEPNGQSSIRLNLRDGSKGRTALHVATKRGAVKLVEKILSLAVDGTHEALVFDQGASSGLTNLHDLLRIVDGRYDLDALAMAVVNGNKRIVYLLTKASLRCESNPYDIAEDEDGETMACQEHEDGEIMPRQVGIDGGSAPNEMDYVTMTPEMLQIGRSEDRGGPAANEVDFTSTLSDVIQLILSEESDDSRTAIEQMYYRHCHFNFLPISLYLFHFTFATWSSTDRQRHLIEAVQIKIFSQVYKIDRLRVRLFYGLRDGLGRPPLHVAVDSNTVCKFLLLEKIAERDFPDLAMSRVWTDILNVKDSAGRTPLFRAAAKNRILVVGMLLADSRVNLHAGLQSHVNEWAEGLDIDKLSWRSDFKSDSVFVPDDLISRLGFSVTWSVTEFWSVSPLIEISTSPLHVAIIHKHEKIVEMIVEKLLQTPVTDRVRTILCGRRLTWPVASETSSFEVEVAQPEAGLPSSSEVRAIRMPFSSKYVTTTIQLAVLVGSTPILQILLKAQEKRPELFSWDLIEEDLPSFLLAAATGKPGTIKAFLNSQEGKFDPSKRDSYMNTALHHALRGSDVKVHPHLLDFVGCDHVFKWRWESADRLSSWVANSHERRQLRRDAEKDDALQLKENQGQREASILLLLQAGVDILAQNKLLQTASPVPDAPQEFVKWWYEKEVQETQQMQMSLNDAANAISVTAALVATASFVGPLQPPLNYGGDPLGLQVEDLSVRIFIVCDTLSFYFALAAIMLALLPALSKPQQPAFKLLVRTRRLVAGAVAFLFPSIVCVLIAFGAGSIAVIREGEFSSHYLTIMTAVVGGSFCLRTIISFMDGYLDVLTTLISNKNLDLGTFFTQLFLLDYVLSIYAWFKARKVRRELQLQKIRGARMMPTYRINQSNYQLSMMDPMKESRLIKDPLPGPEHWL